MNLLDVSIELDSIDPNVSIASQDEPAIKKYLRQQEFQYLCELKLFMDTLVELGDLLGKASLLSSITQQHVHFIRLYSYPSSTKSDIAYTYFYNLYHALSSVLKEDSIQKGETNED